MGQVMSESDADARNGRRTYTLRYSDGDQDDGVPGANIWNGPIPYSDIVNPVQQAVHWERWEWLPQIRTLIVRQCIPSDLDALTRSCTDCVKLDMDSVYKNVGHYVSRAGRFLINDFDALAANMSKLRDLHLRVRFASAVGNLNDAAYELFLLGFDQFMAQQCANMPSEYECCMHLEVWLRHRLPNSKLQFLFARTLAHANVKLDFQTEERG
jgi:hypothetical protein